MQRFGVAVELCFQHFVGGACVGFGRVGIFQVLVAIEFVGGRQGALLQLVVDDLYVDELPSAHVDIDSRTKELFGQQGHVETVAIEAGQVASLDVAGNHFGYLLEGGAIGHIFVVDTMYGRRLFGDVHFGVDAHCLRLFVSVRIDLQVTDFHNAIRIYVYTRCLQVEEDERVFQIQIHELMCQYANLPMCQCAHLIVPVIGTLAYWHIGTSAYYFLVIQHHRHEQHQQVFVLLLFGGHKHTGA